MKEYNMRVKISGYDASKTNEIMDAVTNEWKFDFGRWNECNDELTGTADGILFSARESEEDITKRLTIAVWRTNRKYCKVSVNIEDTDIDPYMTYSLDTADYEREIEGTTNDMFFDVWGQQDKNEGCLNHAPNELEEKTPMSNALKHSDEIQKLVEAVFEKAPSFEQAVEFLTESADLVCHAGCNNPEIGAAAGWIEQGVTLGIIAETMGKPIYEVHVERSVSRNDGDEAWFYFCDNEKKIVETLTRLATTL